MSISLSDHSFMKRLGQLATSVIEETLAVDKVSGDYEFTRPFRKHEEYMRTVLLAAGELETVCEQLDQTVCFLSNFRSTQKLKEHGITRLDHVVFHLENHLIRMVASFDRALILDNEVFMLGNDPRNCTRQVILRNLHIAGTPVAEVLTDMNRYVEPYRGQRNVIIHREQFKHEDMRQLELLYRAQQLDPSFALLHFTKRETDRFVADRKAELASANEGLFKIVDRLFSRLEKEFAKRYDQLGAAA
jgi:hypothetical protein